MTGGFEPRRIGNSDVEVSRICLGTMRLDRCGDAAAAADILRHAFDLGITSLHCSSEYETFPLFAAAWRMVAAEAPAAVRIIAKVASPHFGEARFSPDAFRNKVESYLETLAIERVDVVQWLLRYDLKQEDARLRILEEAADPLARLIDELKRMGKIAACVGFPYTEGLGRRLLGEEYCDGLALYVNPLEREMDSLVAAVGDTGKSVVAIRPFAAGRLFAETEMGVEDALAHVFSFDAVATAVVSASSRDHLNRLCAFFADDHLG